MRIRLPADALVVLVGPAGCGKTTFARRLFADTEVVSSDRMRAAVADDEDDHRASADAFRLMHEIVGMRLKRGRLTVADATNVRAEKRAELLAIAERHRRPAVALVFDFPASVCLERNAVREVRRLPPPAILGQMKDMRASLPHLAEEGFSAVVLLRPEDADRVAVERLSAG